MLRLPPTTLALTMAEVKEFEQRRRFKRYLSKNQTFVNTLPLGPRIETGATDEDRRDRGQPVPVFEDAADPAVVAAVEDEKGNEGEAPRPLLSASLPSRPKEGPDPDKGSGSQSNSNANSNSNTGSRSGSGSGSGSNSKSESLQTLESASGSSAVLQAMSGVARPPGPPAPAPFPEEAHAALELQPLLSQHRELEDFRAQLAARPTTPPRRSSLNHGHGHRNDDASASPSTVRGRPRIFSSAVRFMESVMRSSPTNRSSPSRSPSPSQSPPFASAAASPSASPRRRTRGRRATAFRRSVSASATPVPTRTVSSSEPATFTIPLGAGRYAAGEEGEEEEEEAGAGAGASTPRLAVYNDAVPASLQPQTPLHLPEARHQSRLLGSYHRDRDRDRGAYTAPVRRTRAATREGAAYRRRLVAVADTPGRGFRGLYGGAENLEDVVTLFGQEEGEEAASGPADRRG